MEQSRKAIVQGDVTWKLSYNVRRLSTYSYRTRIAFDTWILTKLGDENGVVAYEAGGDAAISGPNLFLDDTQGTWEYQPGTVTARLRPQKRNEQIDIRCIGLLPRYSSHTRSPDAIWSYPERDSGRTYKQERRNGLEVVEAIVGANRKIVWHIDVSKGSNPIKVEDRVDDQVIAEARSTLSKFDGIWFPSKVEYYSSGRPEPKYVIEVSDAVLAGKDLPRRFVPEDIGIEAGLTVLVEGVGSKCWSGEDLVSMDQFYKAVKEGRRSLGPSVAKMQGGLRQARTEGREVDLRKPVIEMKHVDTRARLERRADSAGTKKGYDAIEDAWTKYTKDFIQANALSESQSASALGVLEDCLKAARKAPDVKPDSTAKPPPSDTQKSASSKPVVTDTAPLKDGEALDRIFKKELVPRLDGLLTQDQRAARAKREQKPTTSRPS